ncbi:hypothetical protein K2173_000406 [Erythroxylum novogranatense]|uniref:Potassium transporter n=1 Tax=Erythroxylum novogranatense TaxID=1862640 RepID=A0AAV8SXE2_9ROSI|nr:hypothetical protein K2173_000406 [Erythroxylum novogranatense]
MNSTTDEELENRGKMWALQQQFDHPSMDEEAGQLRSSHPNEEFSNFQLLLLAFQSLGVVYGDLGTSPLYVFYNTFPEGIKYDEDVIGALSVIIYSLTLIPLLKYVFIVSRANDNGQGGTFALYSLLCRQAQVKTIPNQDHSDEQLTTYSRSLFHEHSFAAKTKKWFERQSLGKNALLFLVLIGSCMVIGDGILTPAISVLSAVEGIKLDHPQISNDVAVVLAVAILVFFFSVQRCGTDAVSWLFAPIVLLWFMLIGGIGVFNLWKYGPKALKAFSPVYLYRYFKRGRKDAWNSLGGIMLCITGTEALFADLSHFPVPAIQLAFTVVVFPSLLLAYCGQAAYLMIHMDHVNNAFYRSIPDSIYWPVLIIAICAAIVASQATISATFTLIKQALAVDCFPRVKIVHTSKKFQHQVYIPDINWILMILCIIVTAGFRNQSEIGNASGTAVVIVMLVTTFLMTFVMILTWRCHWTLVLVFTVLSLIVEGTYFSAVLFKVYQGGWVPLAIAFGFFMVMYGWHYGKMKRYEFEMHSRISLAWILGLGPSLGLVRVPGVGLVYSELASGVPNIFTHFITNLPAIHSVLIFVCVKYLPVHTVPEAERFLVRRIGPKDFHMFRCVVRYGYKDLHKRDDEFENRLFESIFLLARLDSLMDGGSDSDASSINPDQNEQCSGGSNTLEYDGNELYSIVDATISSLESTMPISSSPLPAKNTNLTSNQVEVDEMEFLKSCRDAGVSHILGNTVVVARSDSRWYKKIAIDYMYAFLRKLCRSSSVVLNIPHESLLNVGQIIHV